MKKIINYIFILLALFSIVSCSDESIDDDYNSDYNYDYGYNDNGNNTNSSASIVDCEYVWSSYGEYPLVWNSGVKSQRTTATVVIDCSAEKRSWGDDFANILAFCIYDGFWDVKYTGATDLTLGSSSKVYFNDVSDCWIEIEEGNSYKITVDASNCTVTVTKVNTNNSEDDDYSVSSSSIVDCESIWSSYGEYPLVWDSSVKFQRKIATAVIDCSSNERYWGDEYENILAFCIYDGSSWAIKYTGATDITLGTPSKVYFNNMKDNWIEIEEGNSYKITVDAVNCTVKVEKTAEISTPVETIKYCTLALYSNDGHNNNEQYTLTENTTCTLPKDIFTRTGYSLSGWATSRTGSKVYSNGANVKVSENSTLYAVWTPVAQDGDDWEYVGDMPYGMSTHNVVVKDGMFVITVEDIVLTSKNGIDWSEDIFYDGDYRSVSHSIHNLNGRLYNVGGLRVTGDEYDEVTNLVSYSDNGTDFTRYTSVTGLTGGIYYHAGVTFNNALWVFGGETEEESWDLIVNNNVWKSTNGYTWTKQSVTGLKPRAGHKAVVYNNKIYITGGFMDGGQDEYNDVLVSTNGTTWQTLTSNAPWAARNDHSLVANADGMWLIGGNDGEFLNDVWFSSDGTNWELVDANPPFEERAGHACAIKDGYLYVFGGCNTDWDNPNNLSDVWRKYIGIPEPELPSEYVLKISNDSIYPINTIYIKESSTSSWGANKISSSLSVGSSLEFVLKPTTYDIKVYDTKGRYRTICNISLNDDYTQKITNSSWIEPVVVVPKYSYTIKNNYSYELSEVYYRVSGSSSWILAASNIASGNSKTLGLLESGKNYELKFISQKKLTTSTSGSTNKHNRNRPATLAKPNRIVFTKVYYYENNKLDSNRTIIVSSSSSWSTTNK